MAETESLRKRMQRLHDQLVAEREQWIPRWKTISDYIQPFRARFLLDDANKPQVNSLKIIDSTGTRASRITSAGLMSGVTSPARAWFRMDVADPALMDNALVKRWLFQVERILRDVLTKSNLYNQLPLVYENVAVFGTAALYEEEDADDQVRFWTFPVGSFCASNNKRLAVDTVSREYRMTVRQLVEEFGIDQVSDAARAAHDAGRLEEWRDVVHVIAPNPQHDARKLDARFKRYLSVHWEKTGDEEQGLLRESGYDQFPVFVPRWHTTGEDAYGVGPGVDALPDVKELQLLEKRGLQAIDKQVDPPLVASAQLQSRAINTVPGGVTFHSGNNAGDAVVRPLYQVAPQTAELQAKQAEVRGRINGAFFVDIFLMFADSDRRQITAEEIRAKQEEKLLMLGPVLERLDKELLDPLIERTFAICLRRGLLPRPPEELQGMELRIQYLSILSQAQRMLGISSVDRLLGVTGNMAAIYPGVTDKINADQAIDVYADMLGTPPDLVRSDEEVAAMRQAKAQMMQQQQAMQAMQANAQSAKLLSETDTRGENALTDLLRAGTGAAP